MELWLSLHTSLVVHRLIFAWTGTLWHELENCHLPRRGSVYLHGPRLPVGCANWVWNSGMSILQFVVRSRSLVAARGVFVDCTPGTCSRAAYWVGDRPTVCLLVWCCWWEQRPGGFCSRSKCLSRGPAVFLR